MRQSNFYCFSVPRTKSSSCSIQQFLLYAPKQAFTAHNSFSTMYKNQALTAHVRNIFEFRAVFDLLLLPNRPRLDCRISGPVVYQNVFGALRMQQSHLCICACTAKFRIWRPCDEGSGCTRACITHIEYLRSRRRMRFLFNLK